MLTKCLQSIFFYYYKGKKKKKKYSQFWFSTILSYKWSVIDFQGVFGLKTSHQNLILPLKRGVEISPFFLSLDFDPLSFFSNGLKSIYFLVFTHIRAGDISIQSHFIIFTRGRISPFNVLSPSLTFQYSFLFAPKVVSYSFSRVSGLKISQHNRIFSAEKDIQISPSIFEPRFWPFVILF